MAALFLGRGLELVTVGREQETVSSSPFSSLQTVLV